MASTAVFPKGSTREGTMTTSASSSTGQVGWTYPRKVTAPARSGRAARWRSSASYHS